MLLQKSKAKILIKASVVTFVSLMLVFSIFSCREDLDDQFSIYEDKPIGLYLESHKDFTLWSQMLKVTGMYNAFNIMATYTAFVPDDEAVKSWMNENGYSSISEIDKEYLEKVVKYHTIKTQFKHSDFVTGYLPDTTYTGDKLTTEFRSGGIREIYINNEALITVPDIEAINGVIHRTNKVLTVVNVDIYGQLSNNPTFSIFAEAFERTGYNDKLKVDENYTCFAVTNEVYAADGINSIDDLIAKYSDSDDLMSEENGLNRYIGYHVLNDSYSYADLSTFPSDVRNKNLLTVLGNELVNIQEHQAMLQINKDDQTEDYIAINEENMNVLATNGIIHEVDDAMPVYTPKPTTFVWYFCNEPELQAQEFYRTNVDNAKYSVEDIEFERIKFNITPRVSGSGLFYLQRFTWLSNPQNDSEVDAQATPGEMLVCININKPAWIEVKTPTIVKGKYRIHMGVVTAPGRWTYQTFIDGERGAILNHHGWGARVYEDVMIEKTFNETSEHTFKFVWISGQFSQFHHIRFEPIEE